MRIDTGNMLGGQINKSPVSNFLMMVCAKNYCTLLIFGRVIFEIKGGVFLDIVYITSHGYVKASLTHGYVKASLK